MGLMVGQDREAPVIKRQQQGEGIMISAGIYSDEHNGRINTIQRRDTT